MTLQQSPEIQRIKSLQGGSSSTAPSFIRSEYNQNSSLSSATDLGTVTNLTRIFTGDIGSETGRNTLFFKVETTDPSDVRIFKNFVNTRTDKDIAVGLLDTNRHQIILDSDGFGQINEVHNTPELESLRKLPRGVYYFTVASSQWQSAPFSITLQVIRSRELFGSTSGTASPTLRLALVKLFGTAEGNGFIETSIVPSNKIKLLGGSTGGTAAPTLSLTIMEGTILMTLVPHGRLKHTYRISGTASGTSSNSATLTVTTPGGGY